MTTTHDSYASDEDVALLGPSDVGPLFPDDQLLAAGIDGVVDASDRWTLHSASTSFSAAGLRPGHLVRLTGPAAQFPAPGTLFGVAQVADHSVTLRRLGMAPGLGAPVAPAEGLSGVSFVATTLGPQLALASREIDDLLGIAPEAVVPVPFGFEPGAALRDAAVRLVLARRYAAIAPEPEGILATRARLYEASFDRLLTRLLIGDRPGDPGRASRFGTRLVR